MKSSHGERSSEERGRSDVEDGSEAEADQLLIESLSTTGRGEYPFYTRSYLRRMRRADEQAAVPDESEHTGPPPRSAKELWRVARKARLTTIEMDIIRATAGGADLRQAATKLGIQRRRAARLLKRAVFKMRRCVAEEQSNVSEQIAWVLYEEQRRRGARCESHCKPGQEACRKTGLCVRRWYLGRD